MLIRAHFLLSADPGTIMFMWEQVMRRPIDDMRIFAMNIRKELRSRTVHAYIPQRLIYARKPEA